MKKSNLSALLFVGSIFSPLFFSCNNGNEINEGVHLISLDLDNHTTVMLDDNNLVKLETNDSSLLYDINTLEYCNGSFIINSRDFVRKFDATSGKYLGDLAKRGEGPGEYTVVSGFWKHNDTLNLWDNNVRHVFQYLPDGNFIKSFAPFHNGDSVKSTPQFFIESPGKGFYTVNFFTDGTTSANPKYSYYDENMNFVRDIPDREIIDGSFMSDRFSYDNEGDRVLAWEALKDTLFILTPERVIPIYAFEFGKYSMPKDLRSKPDFYDRIEKFVEKDADVWASFMRFFQVKDDHLFFSFITNRYENYLGIMDMNTEKTKVIKLEDPDKKWMQQSFFKVMEDDSILIACNDTTDIEKNPALYKLKIPL